MKINCGPSRLERFHALEDWHPYFTWWPQRAGSPSSWVKDGIPPEHGPCYWLEWIERRRIDYYADPSGSVSFWEYRPRQTPPIDKAAEPAP